MAITPCKECGRDVSTLAETCPHCGAPEPSKHPPPPPSSRPAQRQHEGVREEDVGFGKVVGGVILGAIVLVGVLSALGGSGEPGGRPSSSDPTGLRGAASLPPVWSRYAHGDLNLRAGPSTEDSVVRTISRDEKVYISPPDSSGWAPVRANADPRADTVAWVYAELLHSAEHPATLAKRKRDADRAIAERLERARREYAEELEDRLLDQGIDAHVRVRGSNATRLEMEYILFSRVWAHQFTKNGEIFRTLRGLGFKRFDIMDGYDYHVYWDL